MSAIYIPPNNTLALKNNLATFELESSIKSILFFMADTERYSETTLLPILKNCTKPIIGGIFPELISKGERKKSGVLLLPLSFELNIQQFNLSDSTEEFLNQLKSVQRKSFDPSSVLFVFADALSSNKVPFIETLFNYFGINPTYIGGGAGSLKFEPFPCIISNNGIHNNSAVIGWSNKSIALGVAHGWRSISESLKVTKSHNNELISINWRPAFEVYKEKIETHSGLILTTDNFFDIAKSYPLGVAKLDAEMIVRDPFRATENTLHLVDSISEGEYIEILHGDINSLLAGAARAREIAISKLEPQMDTHSFFCIDCISRALFMQDNFSKELEVISHNIDMSGILTIGEIANSEGSYLEIYNKAIVVALW